ncbi:MAG: glycine zipper family protein [Proteobacteria bacterium]|nr:glycine zipper family protein [Pseudomonadota bacterium]
MMRHTTLRILVPGAALLLLAGCAAPTPTGPTITSVPPAGKSLTLFQNDDYTCRNYAQQTVAYPAATQNAQGNGVATAAIGTGLGAAAGALLGAAGGNAGMGAAIGAGAGLLGGSAVGASQTQRKGESLQQIYNNAYAQCMTSRGNGIVPGGYGGPGYGAPAYGYGAPAYGY